MKPINPRINPSLLPDGSVSVVIAEHQDEYLNLPSVRTAQGQVITRWSLSDEEIQRLVDGEDLYITILSSGTINPLLPTVGVVNWNGASDRPERLPSYPIEAKDVPGNYALKGDGRWYPHP